MNLWSLLISELRCRWVNAAAAVAAVAIGVATVASALLFFQQFDNATEQQIAQLQAESALRIEQARQHAAIAAHELQDDYRRITKGMGFNVMVLPPDQNMEDWLRDDFGSVTMDESLAQRLADGKVLTINHLLPALVLRTHWPERQRDVILVGIRGQVATNNASANAPIIRPVPHGRLVLGHLLAANLSLRPNDTVRFHNTDYTVHAVYPPRGNKDDISIWIDLPVAQNLANLPGRINVIFALQCNCSTIDRVAEIENEVRSILGMPVHVVEFAGQALARAQARVRAAQAAEELVQQTSRQASQQTAELARARADIREQRSAYAAIALPAILLAVSIALAGTAMANVRKRRDEIGLLNAIGLTPGRILLLFSLRIIILALIGSALGLLIACLLAAPDARDHTMLTSLLLIALAAPLVAMLAGWLPAYLAARMDPAAALRGAQA
mgnify:CR=1 FL=1